MRLVPTAEEIKRGLFAFINKLMLVNDSIWQPPVLVQQMGWKDNAEIGGL